MKKIRSIFIVFVFSLLAVIGASIISTQNVQATSGGYALKPAGESNDNVDISNGSYVITGDPGQTVDLKLMVINQESSKRNFLYRVNTGYTNNNGELAYDSEKVTDPSLKIQTKDTATPQKSVFSVPGNTTATITFKITIPKEKFKGTLLGGVNVAPYKEKAKGTVASNGTLLKNKFSYSVPIQIHQKGAESDPAKLSIRSVKPNRVVAGAHPSPGVLANVHNSQNDYIGNMSVKAVVTKKGDKSFKIVSNSSNQSIAPTTNYNYTISWGKKALQSGNYHLKMTYKTKGGLKGYVLNKDFSITNDDAAKYNKLAGIKPNYLWLYILLAILALAIILGLGIYLGKRNNNKNNNGSNNGGNTTRRRRR
ncbi:DUF3324 domain-containing protein [Companilactobacillus zhachilii]|uniref:DUF3324 domain-containing protein n=1 Tax=Companilactobacillus zhachilii TaxID=2304606 RepID=A0A386PVI0_9LACO|nr:DUF3324 domain-containing protein [Companilactobacillus zhachilii]AYE38959.1 DUF3324 domain-containing protein [Companilactobacillus zhachilii]